jgi:hypothetical protein
MYKMVALACYLQVGDRGRKTFGRSLEHNHYCCWEQKKHTSNHANLDSVDAVSRKGFWSPEEQGVIFEEIKVSSSILQF